MHRYARRALKIADQIVLAGSYRFDPSVRDALVSTHLDGEMPVDLLLRLPEWCCVYVDAEIDTWSPAPMTGYFASLGYEPSSGEVTLDMLVITTVTSIPLWVPLVAGTTVEQAMAQVAWHSEYPAQALAAQVQPLLSLLLYLCADEPEVDPDRQPNSWPPQPHVKRVRRGGERLFAPSSPRIWHVGRTIGETLRQERVACRGSVSGGRADSPPAPASRTLARLLDRARGRRAACRYRHNGRAASPAPAPW